MPEQADKPASGALSALEELTRTDCSHVRAQTLCAPCAGDVVRPVLQAAIRDANAGWAEAAKQEKDAADWAKTARRFHEELTAATKRANDAEAAVKGKAVVSPEDLAAVLSFATPGGEEIAVIGDDALTRLFAALKAALPEGLPR